MAGPEFLSWLGAFIVEKKEMIRRAQTTKDKPKEKKE